MAFLLTSTFSLLSALAGVSAAATGAAFAGPPPCRLVAVTGPTTCRRLATEYAVDYGGLVAANHASMCHEIAAARVHTRPTRVCIPYAAEEPRDRGLSQLGGKSMARSGGSWWDSVIETIRDHVLDFPNDLPQDAPVQRPSQAPGSSGGGSVAAKLLCLVNQERQRHGRRPLGLNPRLVDAAQRQSNDMARHVRMDHVGTDGSQIADRARDAGYTPRGLAENIAVGQTSEEDVNRSWIRSAGHYRNMLGEHQHFGAAVARGGDGRLYWTEMFGSNGGAHLNYPVCP